MNTILERSSSVIAVALVSLGGAVTAHAGPCSADIARLQKIVLSETPFLPQNDDIELHHQPTVRDVDDALKKAKAEAVAMLDRARKTDAEGDAAACSKAVAELKKLYAID